MKFPFVSRERLEEQQRRCAVLEEQVREMLQAFVPALRRESAYPPMEPVTPQTDLASIHPIPGRPTLASITSMANKDARDRAKNPNAQSVAQELKDAQFRGWRDAKRG
jgi:hypothetical protein